MVRGTLVEAWGEVVFVDEAWVEAVFVEDDGLLNEFLA